MGTQEVSKDSKLGWLSPLMEPMKECPLCAGQDWKLKYSLGVLQVHACSGCGMMFLNPYLSPEGMKKIFSSPELLTRISNFFADYGKETSWHTPKTLSFHRKVLSRLEKIFPNKGNLLDVGCGQGSFLRVAKSMGWKAAGLEPNCSNRVELERDFGIRVYELDFFKDTLPNEKFDVVSLWDLIEHVPDPGSLVNRCLSLLYPGGLFVAATPNHASLLDSLGHSAYGLSGGRFKFALEKLYTVDHTLYFTDSTLSALLKAKGFEIECVMKMNTDLSRYAMSPVFRAVSELLLLAGSLLHQENRVLIIARSASLPVD